ncbi:MAG: pyridoxine 5'-phosphate synthase [Candidatus Aminicenantes bacterium]|nr:MAG: pyridoxine 5'-phosphate synthase [Candidatus Aminicenantes bacterium]
MKLAVNVDHIATIREARRHTIPDPVLAALLAEQAGAEGIVCHIRSDRRHIKERDLHLLKQTVKTKLNIEMAATDEMKHIAMDIKPDIVSLVPERDEEITTEGGLDVRSNEAHFQAHVEELRESGIRVSIFVDPDIEQITACQRVGVDLIEINTGKYADLKPGDTRDQALEEIKQAARHGAGLGLEIHAGHGLDYFNVKPVAAIPEMKEFSIGFAIVARAAIVGIDRAVREMIALIE